MFLHLGGDNVIPLKHVIAVIDFKETNPKANNNFLKDMRAESKVIDISDGNPKSLIITNDYIYVSGISSMTLKKRAGDMPTDDELFND